jgi:fumarate reductase subunit C
MGIAMSYTRYHPKWYRPRVSVWWWLKKKPYTRFVLRELTSVAVAWFAVLFLWILRALAQGPDEYARVLARLESPWMVAINVIALAFVVFHAVTWFNLAPAAIVVRVAGKRVPGWIIAASNYAAWVVVSAIVLWLLA